MCWAVSFRILVLNLYFLKQECLQNPLYVSRPPDIDATGLLLPGLLSFAQAYASSRILSHGILQLLQSQVFAYILDDHSLVSLEWVYGEMESFYINANFIHVSDFYSIMFSVHTNKTGHHCSLPMSSYIIMVYDDCFTICFSSFSNYSMSGLWRQSWGVHCNTRLDVIIKKCL